jgi:site-specific recombinase XerD
MDDAHIEAFLVEATVGRKLRDGGRPTRRFWRRPIELLLVQLRAHGVVAPVDAPVERLGPGLPEYLVFLRQHRGFCERTINRQRLHVTRFLAYLGTRTEDDLRGIGIVQIDRYLVQAARRLARESMGSVCASVRGFLGHLRMRSILALDLRGQVATPHIYPLERMPRSVKWPDIERTLATVDRSSAIGRRDYAALALIAYGGLRGGDVAVLRLGDLDWRNDVIRARRPKSGMADDVPLISILGEALMAYLRDRPRVTHEAIFLKTKAPIEPMAAQGISALARKHLVRAGVKSARLGSHTLRHSLAVELLRQGYSLKAIGDVLGHAHPQSTFIYAKADVEHLREVSLEVLP